MKTLSWLSKEGRAKVNHDKMVRRIRSWLHPVTNEDWDAGIHWYAEANKFCEIVATELGLDLEGVAHCLAILSPQVSWETNKRNTVLLATIMSEEISIFATAKQKREALRALNNKFRIDSDRLKTYCFADNIANPESTRVTVDRHAICVAMNNLEPNVARITPLRYRLVEKAYQSVAKEFNIMPYQVQAIAWLAYKQRVGR